MKGIGHIAWVGALLAAPTTYAGAHGPLWTLATRDSDGFIASSTYVANPAARSCDVDCYEPHTCGSCGHKAPYQGPNEGSHDEGAGAHDYCWDGACHTGVVGCTAQHAICILSDSVNEILAHLDAKDYAGASSLMGSGANLHLGLTEGVLAFLDCNDRVTITIDLTPEEVAMLALADL